MQKTFITNMKLRGFKSFSTNTNLKFGPGFNCIAGANGSGKSNVLDALCFVLGRMSTKSIRADNYSDLIYTVNGQKDKGAFVSITLDNTSGIFGNNAKNIELVREITKEGKTKYWLNGKRATRTQVLELLEMSQIRPEGHNIILQGDIQSFITMSPKEKRKLIEEIAGIGIYERKKESALKELEKVESKLRDVQIIMTEKKSYMNSLEQDKKSAEKYNSYNSELKSAKSTELNLKHTKLIDKRSKLNSKLEKIEKVKSEYKNKISESNKKIDFIKTKIKELEKKIEDKGGEEQLILQKAIENYKSDMENSTSLIKSSNNEIRRIDDRKIQLDKNLKDLEGQIKLSNSDILRISKEEKEIDSKKAKLTGISGNLNIEEIESKYEIISSNLEKFESEKNMLSKDKLNVENEINIIKLKIDNLSEKIEEIKRIEASIKNSESARSNYKKIIQKISEKTNRDNEIFDEIKEIRKEKLDTESDLRKLQLELNASHDNLMRDKAISHILNLKMKGVHGTVAQLGKVDSLYETALKVAAGSRLKNIVVDDENIAIKCLKKLRDKKLGIATFLPLSKIKSNKLSISRSNGVYGVASDIITYDSKYKPIFENILGSTVIIENENTAKSLGIGKMNMVTLEGDSFSRGGSISGGYRRATSLSFAKNKGSEDIEKYITKIKKHDDNIKALEKERSLIDKELINLRKLKSEVEGTVNNMSEPEESSKELILKYKKYNDNYKLNITKTKDLDKLLKSLSSKIEKTKIERNSIKSKIKELKFGKNKKELDNLESKKRNLNAERITIETKLNNVINPEIENLNRVIRDLEKEKNTFHKQISENKIKITKLEKELKIKQNEEKEFFGQLKKLFEEKNKHKDLLEREEEKLKINQIENTGEYEEFNSLTIALAKIDSEMTGLKEEYEDYRKIKTLPYLRNVESAQQKQRELKKKISSLGNVNLKSLEIYDETKKEWDKLNWRLNKLDVEKNSVNDIINAVETKKKSAFMETYNVISENFRKIYSEINNNVVKGELILENKDDPFNGGVMIKVIKPGANSLHSLSGGEKAMVGISFMFAIAEFNPSPFYLLDEIDAPLDGVNVDKMAKILNEYSKKSQIIIISHKDSVMSTADLLHGIWMNKTKGESYISSMSVK